MDVHKKYTVAVAMGEDGKILEREKIVHGDSISGVDWESYFSRFPETPHVAMEATGISYAIYEAIERHCRSVVMAHPLKTKLIAEQKVKTDTIDGRTLAHLRRTDFLPTAHIPTRDVRDQRELLRHRASLLQIQTGLKNRIHALLTRCGEFYSASTDVFGKAGRAYLDRISLRNPYRQELDRFLRLLDVIAGEIRALSRTIEETVKDTPEVARLTTVPGIGKYLAALIYWEIGDINRFPSAAKLVSYCGLGPRVHSSGGRTVHGPITKEGNKFLRWALVEASQKAGTRAGPLWVTSSGGLRGSMARSPPVRPRRGSWPPSSGTCSRRERTSTRESSATNSVWDYADSVRQLDLILADRGPFG
jgi:transposase